MFWKEAWLQRTTDTPITTSPRRLSRLEPDGSNLPPSGRWRSRGQRINVRIRHNTI
jgi:hypothetical protein